MKSYPGQMGLLGGRLVRVGAGVGQWPGAEGTAVVCSLGGPHPLHPAFRWGGGWQGRGEDVLEPVGMWEDQGRTERTWPEWMQPRDGCLHPSTDR